MILRRTCCIAGELVTLVQRTANGAWYHVRCQCGAVGWVHASPLKLDPKVARKVPLA